MLAISDTNSLRSCWTQCKYVKTYPQFQPPISQSYQPQPQGISWNVHHVKVKNLIM